MSSDADGYAAERRDAFASTLKGNCRTIGLSQRALGNIDGLSQRIISAAGLGAHNMTIGTLARIARSVCGDVPKMLTRKDDEPEPGGPGKRPQAVLNHRPRPDHSTET